MRGRPWWWRVPAWRERTSTASFSALCSGLLQLAGGREEVLVQLIGASGRYSLYNPRTPLSLFPRGTIRMQKGDPHTDCIGLYRCSGTKEPSLALVQTEDLVKILQMFQNCPSFLYSSFLYSNEIEHFRSSWDRGYISFTVQYQSSELGICFPQPRPPRFTARPPTFLAIRATGQRSSVKEVGCYSGKMMGRIPCMQFEESG